MGRLEKSVNVLRSCSVVDSMLLLMSSMAGWDDGIWGSRRFGCCVEDWFEF